MDTAPEAGAEPADSIAPETSAPAQAVVEEPAPKKPKAGWVRHIGTDTYHQVEDIDMVFRAYPEQYEEMDAAPGERSKKIGWPAAPVADA